MLVGGTPITRGVVSGGDARYEHIYSTITKVVTELPDDITH